MLVSQGEKNVQSNRDLNPGPLAYRASALPTVWAVQLPDTLSSQWWLSPNRDIHPHKFGTKQACTCHRVRKMCSQTGTRTRDPSHTWWVLYWLSYPAAWHTISPMVTEVRTVTLGIFVMNLEHVIISTLILYIQCHVHLYIYNNACLLLLIIGLVYKCSV